MINGTWYLRGIVSFTVPTDVSKYREWITWYTDTPKSLHNLKPLQNGMVGKNEIFKMVQNLEQNYEHCSNDPISMEQNALNFFKATSCWQLLGLIRLTTIMPNEIVRLEQFYTV